MPAKRLYFKAIFEIMSNRLINETSPYLLQHAENPVDWYPWGEEALEKARTENKLILVSIGYSACHWCHVMAHESFEDETVAAVMNENFICIKIDREERPDLDQIYILAVQLMTGQGGWPLNCICLPDQRPVYGGTYFRKNDWINILQQLAAFWQQKPEDAREYASRLTAGIKETEKLNLTSDIPEYSVKDLEDIYRPWKRMFDLVEGGYKRAPKFPLPNNWQFILRYAHLLNDTSASEALLLTLKKMAWGGIYDHIGGGFSRYSVDGAWHIPHFEKMLYDNAQLISLYSEAYQYSKDDLFKQVVYQTVSWVEREMTSAEGGFYSALDADSEGVEGKFYTFTREEIFSVLGQEEAETFCLYFNIDASGNWPEEHTNVLIRKEEESLIAERLGISPDLLKSRIATARQKLFEYREERVRPGLDSKILSAWNGLMLRGLTDAYRAFGEPSFLRAALRNAEFIIKKMVNDASQLRRVYKDDLNSSPTTTTGFLDDYAFITDGFISLYEATFDENWLFEAQKLAEYVLRDFYDAGTGMFYYTSQTDKELIARKHEISDNVIPSSNSAMALNLFRLGHFFQRSDYLEQADVMLGNIFTEIKTYGPGYSNWSILLLYKVLGVYEIVITGLQFEEKRNEIEKNFIPDKILLGGSSGTLPLLQDKWGDSTKIFVCKNRTCRLPVTEVAEALKQIVNQHG